MNPNEIQHKTVSSQWGSITFGKEYQDQLYREPNWNTHTRTHRMKAKIKTRITKVQQCKVTDKPNWLHGYHPQAIKKYLFDSVI